MMDSSELPSPPIENGKLEQKTSYVSRSLQEELRGKDLLMKAPEVSLIVGPIEGSKGISESLT